MQYFPSHYHSWHALFPSHCLSGHSVTALLWTRKHPHITGFLRSQSIGYSEKKEEEVTKYCLYFFLDTEISSESGFEVRLLGFKSRVQILSSNPELVMLSLSLDFLPNLPFLSNQALISLASMYFCSHSLLLSYSASLYQWIQDIMLLFLKYFLLFAAYDSTPNFLPTLLATAF